jgi:phosphoserine phosphatase RsbU/P
VPIVWKDELLGLVGVDEPGRRHSVSQRDVELVEAICSQAAVAIANAGAYESQRAIAATLQESFRHPLPRLRGLEIGLVEAPAEEPGLVGGDFWDIFELPDRRVFVVIGDVAGKGVAAAGMTETVRSMMRAFATVDAVPAFILRKTNELLLQEPDEAFVTALVLVVDPASGSVSLGSAGHPGPVLLSPSSCRILDPRYGPPLGTFHAEYGSSEVLLEAADYLLLYTDGITEARTDGALFGEEGLLRAASALRGQSAQAVAEGIRRAASSFASRLMDDLQVLALRRTLPLDAAPRRDS